MHEKNIVFLSEYSSENFEIGRALCSGPQSVAGFWRNEELEKSRMDYSATMMNTSTDFSDRSVVIPSSPNSENFVTDLFNVVSSPKFEPDFIIVKGSLTEIWPLSIIKKYYMQNIPLFAILDYVTEPMESFEKETMNLFDILFSMGPSSNISNYKDKTVPVFEKFESIFFKSMFTEMNVLRKGQILILCNQDNFSINNFNKEKNQNRDKISIINVEECPELELAAYLAISDVIVDDTGMEEIPLLVKKMGKICMGIKEFCDYDSNLDRKDSSLISCRKNLEDFSEWLKKKILDNAKIKGNPIVGDTVSIVG